MLWTIIVNDPPYGNEKSWNALRLASTARSEGVDVRLFLMGDSVASAKTGQKTPDGFYNMERCSPPCSTRAWRSKRAAPASTPGDSTSLSSWKAWNGDP